MKLPRVSDHELLCRIGQGAYGQVWLARHEALGVIRAVKIVFRDEFEDERPFHREFEGLLKFEPISRSHPSQLAILHVGQDEAAGCFYYVMELGDPVETSVLPLQEGARITGPGRTAKAEARSGSSSKTSPGDRASRSMDSYTPRTLRSELRSHGRLPVSQTIELGRALATALEHLHGNGLVHRDIKPPNIVYVAGLPKLADIGLITEATDACSIVGTEGYIAPEGPGTPAADLYSLGKVLYEAATGKDRREYPDFPEEVRDWSDAKLLTELNAVILRACAREPHKRYASAGEMRADLDRLLTGQSVRRRHARRRLWMVSLRAGTAITLLAAIVAVAISLSRPPRPDHEGKPSADAEAEWLFLKGRRHYEKATQADLGLALGCFEKAVSRDREFAKGYAWLAASQCWGFAGTNRDFEFLPQACSNASRALAIDNRLVKAHQALAWYAAVHDWDWEGAEKHFQAAHRCAPNNVELHVWHGYFEASIGRTNEGIAKLEQALRLQPDSIQARHFLGSALIMARRYDEAITKLSNVTEMESGGVIRTFSELADALIKAHRYEEGIKQYRLTAIQDGVPEAEATRSANAELEAYRSGGEPGYWELLLRQEKPDSNPYYAAFPEARLGKVSEALAHLEAAERARIWDLVQITTEPAMDGLRNEPRFKQLLHRLHLDR